MVHREMVMPGHAAVILAAVITAVCVFFVWIRRRYRNGRLRIELKRASGLLSILFFAGFMICFAVFVKMGTAYINGKNTYRTVREIAYKNTQAQTEPEGWSFLKWSQNCQGCPKRSS